MIVGGTARRITQPNLAECLPDAASALVGVERHAVMRLEPAADTNWIDTFAS